MDSDTGGTLSPYIDFAYSIIPFVSGSYNTVTSIFKPVIEYKAHKKDIPGKLNKLHSGLGDMFSLVHNNVDKSKNGVMTVKQAISDMRDVLNQIWANLADWSYTEQPEKWGRN